jgi:ectoine hydroxylase-related dioxygenase (phytanoyl-CoA dioxygenase family)
LQHCSRSATPEERRILGAAGSLLVFNGHLWLGGTRNDSASPRRVVQMVLIAC